MFRYQDSILTGLCFSQLQCEIFHHSTNTLSCKSETVGAVPTHDASFLNMGQRLKGGQNVFMLSKSKLRQWGEIQSATRNDKSAAVAMYFENISYSVVQIT